MTSAFICRFLTNFYCDSSLYTLKSSFALIDVLLAYHDPGLAKKLKSSEITPELYCTPWLMTYFSSKLKKDDVFFLWNLVIQFNDETLIFYLIVAVLIYYRDFIMFKEQPSILYFFTNLAMSFLDIASVFYLALAIKAQTPVSFRLLIRKIRLFYPKYQKHKDNFSKYQLNNLEVLPILTGEVLKQCFPDKITCCDEGCDNFNIKLKLDKNFSRVCQECTAKQVNSGVNSVFNNIQNSKHFEKLSNNYNITHIFSLARDHLLTRFTNVKPQLDYFTDEPSIGFDIKSYLKLKKDSIFSFDDFINYIIVDIKNKTNCEIVLPMSLSVTLGAVFTAKDLVKKFLNDKISLHFIIITEDTSNLFKYVNLKKIRSKVNFNLNSSMSKDDLDSSRSTRGQSINRRKTSLRKSGTSSVSSSNVIEITRNDSEEAVSVDEGISYIKPSQEEEDFIHFKELIDEFLSKGFYHISYALKGFVEIHKACIKFDLPLINHSIKGKLVKNADCKFCQIKTADEENSEFLSTNLRKENSFMDKITGFFSKNSDSKKDCNREITYSCLTINISTKTIDLLSVYIFNEKLSLFVKIENGDLMPLEVQIPTHSVKKITKQKEINVMDFAKKIFGLDYIYNSYAGNMNLDIKLYSFSLIMEFMSSISNELSEIILFFVNETQRNDFKKLVLG